MSDKLYKFKYKILIKQIKRVTLPQRQQVQKILTTREEGYNILMMISTYLINCPTTQIEMKYDDAVENLLKIKQDQDNTDFLINIYRNGINLIIHYIIHQVDRNLDKIENKEHVKLIKKKLKIKKTTSKDVILSLLKEYFYEIKIVGEEYLKKSKSQNM
jgi:hypothetical protein